MKKVYLAGPITGLTYDEGQDWRVTARDYLAQINIFGASPLRAKDYLRQLEGKISGTGEEYAHLGCMSTPRGVMTRDRYDATTCDVLLVNVLGAKAVSIGTVMEIAMADVKRIPIVAIMEPGNVHEHMMINEAIGFRVGSLAEGLRVCMNILYEGH